MDRYSSPKDELSHLLKQIMFYSFEISYMTGFLPVKFIKLDYNLYFDGRLCLVCTVFNLVMLMIIHSAYYLRLRGVELQFNAKMSGKWIKVPEPKNTNAYAVQEWQPNVSYP